MRKPIVVVLACLLATDLARAQSYLAAWGDFVFDTRLTSQTTFVEVAAGIDHSVARRSDGSVIAWGANELGQCLVPPLPAGVTYVQIAAAGTTPSLGAAMALRSHGERTETASASSRRARPGSRTWTSQPAPITRRPW